MEQLKRELAEAFRRAARYRRTVVLLNQLYADAEAVKRKQKDLEDLMTKEIADADKLEAGGASVALSRLMGTHQERLEQAREERYAAKCRCEEAARTREEIDRYIADVQAECDSLKGSEEAFVTLYERRMQWLEDSGGETIQRMVELTTCIEEARETIRKADEAKEIGRRVTEYLEAAYRELDGAEDFIGRGSLMMKLDSVDTADDIMQEAQTELEKFNRCLEDIRVMPCISKQEGVSLRFEAVSFSGLIPDWISRNRFGRSLENIKGAKADMQIVIERLHSRIKGEETRLRSLEDEWLVLMMEA